MNKFISVYIFLLFLCSNIYSHTARWIIFGPTFHWHFGGETKRNMTWGLEVSYWQDEHFNDLHFDLTNYIVPQSVNAGIEFFPKAKVVYAEIQGGPLFGGYSVGPVVMFKKGGDKNFGFQGSLWTWLGVFTAFGVVELRVRGWGKSTVSFDPGYLFKIPIPLNEFGVPVP